MTPNPQASPLILLSPDKLSQFYQLVANGDKEAYDFLIAWGLYIHAYDDLVDKDITDPVEMIKVSVFPLEVYNCNFWIKNRDFLMPINHLIIHEYADSEVMKAAPEIWKREWADKLRYCGNHMITAVGMITGGYEHVRKFTQRMREMSYASHHDEAGNPV